MAEKGEVRRKSTTSFQEKTVSRNVASNTIIDSWVTSFWVTSFWRKRSSILSEHYCKIQPQNSAFSLKRKPHYTEAKLFCPLFAPREYKWTNRTSTTDFWRRHGTTKTFKYTILTIHSTQWILINLYTNVTTVVHQKNNFCKNLAKFLQSTQLLQNSCKKYILQNSCNNLATLFHFLQKFCKSCVFCKKNAIFVRILQDLARNKISSNTLRSDNLCISPKSKHNQPLELKFDEL